MNGKRRLNGARTLTSSRSARRNRAARLHACPLTRHSRSCYPVAAMKKPDYLERILNARVYDVALETPLEVAPGLTSRLGNRVLLKREDMQPVFSFKVRGAYNKM